MPIPRAKQIRIFKTAELLQIAGVVIEPELESVREGVSAMLAYRAPAGNGRAVQCRFSLNEALGAERYRLVCGEGGVLAEAGCESAAVHAASALAQLSGEYGGALPECWIEDAPRFGWRGLTLDVCRHFFPMRTVRQLVDLMAYYQFNRLHLHLSDDQGFRFESESFPRLNTVGSFRESTAVKRGAGEVQDKTPHGGYYTKDELRELVRYAKARGVEIVPELDMPGHANAMIAAYPELTCFPDEDNPPKVVTEFGIRDFCKTLLCAGNEKTVAFLLALLDEIMEVFPYEYVHLGGDEAAKTEWRRCPKCQRVLREHALENERELQGWLLNRMNRHLKEHGRRAIVWNDGLCKTLDRDVVCQYWTPFSHREQKADRELGQRGRGGDRQRVSARVFRLSLRGDPAAKNLPLQTGPARRSALAEGSRRRRGMRRLDGVDRNGGEALFHGASAPCRRFRSVRERAAAVPGLFGPSAPALPTLRAARADVCKKRRTRAAVLEADRGDSDVPSLGYKRGIARKRTQMKKKLPRALTFLL
jgi:hypothetical protein